MYCRVVLFTLMCLGVSACQAPNPYVADSAPLPPAPALIQAQPAPAPLMAAPPPGYDASAYPPAPRDWAHYRSWSWFNDRLPIGNTLVDPAQVADAVSQGLDQRGLRPARNGAPGDLRVSADVHMEQRVRQVQDDGYYGGPGYGPYGPYNYYRPPVVRTYVENVMVVDIRLFDGVSGQPLWNAAAQIASTGSESQRADALRQAVAKALGSYPPA